MYFPYLRGRQYELLALRELVQGNLLGNYVTPVVEPIKVTSTFNGTVKMFAEKNKTIALILNPAVGDLAKGAAVDSVLPFISGTVIPTVIIGNDALEAMKALVAKNISGSDVATVMINRDYLDVYRNLFIKAPPKFTLFPDERQIRRTVSANKVMFDDKFKKQEKNADYLNQEDEFYSDDHLYFSEEGFSGFGDYSVIGNEYVESGFAPYAVVIHIIYFASDDTLRVRHFVSDSNADIRDVAGKYYEAVTKLKKWYDSGQTRQSTTALAAFLAHAENGYYPGLPTIKKLSIMHHLELVGKYLNGGLGK
ncbi:MAG: sce7725 family protein [Firmicutes bacterium]|nr:sce7725 family protein [Bacillota bacterium]